MSGSAIAITASTPTTAAKNELPIESPIATVARPCRAIG